MNGCIAAALASFSLLAFPDDENARPSQNGDMICGPRCVKYILDFYDRDSDLISIIQEMQGGSLESGTSLAFIERSLADRGLYVCALQVSSDAVLSFPYPVVVHLAATEQEPLGHFAV